MRILAVSAAALLGASFAYGAQAQQATGSSADHMLLAQQQQRMQQAPSPSTQANKVSTSSYVQNQARGDMFEIQAAQIAQQKAQNSDVKQFAQNMITDHKQSTSMLQQTLKAGNIKVTPPKSLDKRHSDELAQLKSTPSGQFDQAYLQSQVQAHREMLALNDAYSQTGDNAKLRQFSQEVTPIIQRHLSELQQMASGAGATPGSTTGVMGSTGVPPVAGTRGSSGSLDVLDPGTGADSGSGAAGEQVIQHEPIGPGGPRQFDQPGRTDGGPRDD